jgi:RNA polymerase sigma factor (sigma-70 family)
MDENEKYLKYKRLISLAIKNLHIRYDNWVELQDYIDAGTDGIIKGIRHYDTNSKAKESTYVYACICNEIRHQIVFNKLLKNTKNLSYNIETDDGTELIDFIPSEYDLEEEVKKKINGEKVISIINTLNPREQYIVKSKYGIDKHQEKTIQAIANELGLSHQRVHILYNNAISKIYKKLKVVNDEY